MNWLFKILRVGPYKRHKSEKKVLFEDHTAAYNSLKRVVDAYAESERKRERNETASS